MLLVILFRIGMYLMAYIDDGLSVFINKLTRSVLQLLNI